MYIIIIEYTHLTPNVIIFNHLGSALDYFNMIFECKRITLFENTVELKTKWGVK
jgi:hypothetical protein